MKERMVVHELVANGSQIPHVANQLGSQLMRDRGNLFMQSLTSSPKPSIQDVLQLFRRQCAQLKVIAGMSKSRLESHCFIFGLCVVSGQRKKNAVVRSLTFRTKITNTRRQ